MRDGVWEIDWSGGPGEERPFLREARLTPDGEMIAAVRGALAERFPGCRMIHLRPGRVVFANEGHHLPAQVLFRCHAASGVVDEYSMVFDEGTLGRLPDVSPCAWELYDDGPRGRRRVEERSLESGAKLVYWGTEKAAAETQPFTNARSATRPGPVDDAMRNTERAVTRALDWLRRHQNPDGSWSQTAFAANCDRGLGAPCAGSGTPGFDPGVTGLAILAFLGAGFDSQVPSSYFETVRNGLKQLKSRQDTAGAFGSTQDAGHLLSHAWATLAMCEAFESSRQLPWRKCAEKAVDYARASQTPYKGWRGGPPGSADDARVTSWMLLALDAARKRLPVDDRGVRDGLAFLDRVTNDDRAPRASIVRALAPRVAWNEVSSPRDFDAIGLDLLEWTDPAGAINADTWYLASRALRELGGTGGGKDSPTRRGRCVRVVLPAL